MPLIRCPLATCAHNTSTAVRESGLCVYDGVVNMLPYEGEDDQYLDCCGYERGRGKRLDDPDGVAIRGTVYYPVEVE